MTPKERLIAVLPHIHRAAEVAKATIPNGQIGLGILATRADGTGYVASSFECEEFFSDLAAVLGVCIRCGEPTHEGTCDPDDLNAIATNAFLAGGR